MDKVKEKGLIERMLDWAWNKDIETGNTIPVEFATPSNKQASNNSLFLWKDKSGLLNWLATYSNNIRDNDHPVREIISAESHLNFEKKVDAGEWPMPEAWHWHEHLWKWGEATMIATDVKEDGKVFAIAGGYVLPGAEFMAEALAETGDAHAVSHGMPHEDILRDSKDRSVLVQHRTSEISSLPSDKAANPFTFISTKEKDSMITNEKRAEAAAVLGVTEDQLSQLEAMNANAAGKATEEGRDTKETSPAPVHNNDIKSLSEMLAGLTAAVEDGFKALSEQNAQLRAEVDTLKANAEKEKVEMSPAAAIYNRISSAIGAPETKVDGRTKLAKQGPQESDVQNYVNANLPGTGISFIDKIKEANMQKARGGEANYG